MTLLREIQNAAVDANIDISTLLRKCKILAARLGNAEFKQWVENELNGYSEIKQLPQYRILIVHSKGHFSGPFQTGMKNAPIPLICIPEDLREGLGHCYLAQPIAALQALVGKGDEGFAREPWDPTLVALVGQQIYKNMNCVQAWKVIPTPHLVAAIEAVRNKILSFVLEIEAEAPTAGEAQLNSPPLPQEKVQQIFNTYITGNVQNLATGSSNFKQTANGNEVKGELFGKLLQAVQAIPDLRLSVQVATSVEKMRTSQGTPSIAQNYKNFMSILADHMQVLGPIVAPYLPALATIVHP